MANKVLGAVLCAALAAAACVALMGSGTESEQELLQRVVYRQRLARQPRAATYQGLPVATAVPLQPARQPARHRQQRVLRAGGADPNAPKQINAPRVPPKTGTSR